MNDPTAQRAVSNIMRRQKAEHKAKKQTTARISAPAGGTNGSKQPTVKY